MFELLEKLCMTAAPSGCETNLHELIRKEIEPYVDEIKADAMGNLIAHKKGDGKKLLFCAHMDEVGLIVTCIGEDGKLYVSPLGGISPYVALGQRVVFSGGVQGVVALDGKEEELLKNLKPQNLYVDIGAKDEAEAASMVALGESATFVGHFSSGKKTILSKALDDRCGCFVLIKAMQALKTHKNDLYILFTAEEELGLRGAKAFSSDFKVDYAIACDVTRTGDTPSSPRMSTALGKGVAIKIKDHSFLAHQTVKEKMIALCQERSIPYQLEVLEKGGTDTGAIHLSGGGVPSGCISIPTRYIHSPGEMIHKDDLSAAVSLAQALMEEGI